MARIKDITGQRFGILTVVSFAGLKEKTGLALWKCKCDCGNVTIKVGSYLVKCDVKSCGCKNKWNITKKDNRLIYNEPRPKKNIKSVKCVSSAYLQEITVDNTDELIENASNAFLKEQINKVLETLPPREKQAIEMRYGLNGGELFTYEDIGRFLV